MIRLVQTFGAHTGRSLVFDQALVRLGRMPDGDVVFDAHADIDASGRHAEIRLEEGEYVLVDCASRNGTWVNGQRVERCVLRRGDEIEFGPGGPRMRVDDVGAHRGSRPSAAGAATMESTPVPHAVRGDAATVLATPSTPAPSPSTPAPSPSTPAPSPSTPGYAMPSGSTEVDAAPKRYGQQTLGVMIQAAIDDYRKSQNVPLALKVAVIVMAVAVVVVIGGGIAFVALRAPANKPAPNPAQTLHTHGGAMFAVVANNRTLCSAFAVRPDLLATTASCVSAVEQARAGQQSVDVRGQGGTALITQMWTHPSFRQAQGGADVGLMQIQGQAPRVVSFASMQKLTSMAAPLSVVGLGFAASEPAVRTYPAEIVEFDSLDGPGQRCLYGGSMPSGAALIDAEGDVVGLHAASGGGAEGSGHGIRSDVLLGLLAGMGPEI